MVDMKLAAAGTGGRASSRPRRPQRPRPLEETRRAPGVLGVEVLAIASIPCRNPRRSRDLGHADLARSINRAKPPDGPIPVQLDARGVPISRSVGPQLLASLLWNRYTSWGTRADSAPRLRIRLDCMPALASYATATNPASSAHVTALSHSPNSPHMTRPGRFSAMPVWVTRATPVAHARCPSRGRECPRNTPQDAKRTVQPTGSLSIRAHPPSQGLRRTGPCNPWLLPLLFPAASAPSASAA